MNPEVVWRESAWCSGCQQPSRVLMLDADRMVQAALNGGWSARYGSVAEREHLRQAIYRVARARGLDLRTRSEGGRVGLLHVRARRPDPAPRAAAPVGTSEPLDDPRDIEAVRELRRHIRRLLTSGCLAGKVGSDTTGVSGSGLSEERTTE